MDKATVPPAKGAGVTLRLGRATQADSAAANGDLGGICGG